MLAVLIVVGVLVLGGGGAYVLTSDDDESGQDDTTSGTTPGDGQGEPSSTADGQGDGSGSAPAGGTDPLQVVESYVAAAGGGDCGAAVTLVTENMLDGMSRDMAVDECERGVAEEPQNLEIYNGLQLRPAQEDGDTATVDGTGDLDGQPLLLSFTLVRDGDTWLIDSIG